MLLFYSYIVSISITYQTLNVMFKSWLERRESSQSVKPVRGWPVRRKFHSNCSDFFTAKKSFFVQHSARESVMLDGTKSCVTLRHWFRSFGTRVTRVTVRYVWLIIKYLYRIKTTLKVRQIVSGVKKSLICIDTCEWINKNFTFHLSSHLAAHHYAGWLCRVESALYTVTDCDSAVCLLVYADLSI